MPYLLMAGYFDALGPLNCLIDQLVCAGHTQQQTQDGYRSARGDMEELDVLYREAERVKAAARRDIRIFCDQGHHYVNHHLQRTGAMVIALKELKQEINADLLIPAAEKSISGMIDSIVDLLKALMDFFSALNEQASKC